jgi:hypothetical protein
MNYVIVDLERYNRLALRGLASYEKEDTIFKFIFKRFNTEDGTEIEPEILYVNKEHLEEELTKYTSKVDILKSILE